MKTLFPGIKRSKLQAELNARSGLFPEKVTVPRIGKAIPAFYGSWRFITVRELKRFHSTDVEASSVLVRDVVAPQPFKDNGGNFFRNVGDQ